MKILSIDSSGLVASVAVIEDNQVISDYSINYKKTHSQTLVPMLDEIKKMTELDLNTIDAIAIAKGPGSFTGLRIGSATAKGLGLALNKPLIPVGTLEGLAMNMWGYDGLICPIMDARREQVYTGVFRFSDGNLETLINQQPMGIEELIEKLNSDSELKSYGKVIFLGDGCPVYEDTIKAKMNIPYEFAPAHMNRQRAASLGVLAMKYYIEGKIESASEHKPDYLRLSQAERERLEAMNNADNS